MDMRKDGHKFKSAPCASCGALFNQRLDGRPRTCSRSCAMRLRLKLHGSPTWKGGTAKHGSGYIKQKAFGHPYADKESYVMQHRLVVEKQLGRVLSPKERVHHKNGVRDDNRPENLELWTLDHKDPPGIRAIDAARAAVAKLSAEDRTALFMEYK